MTVNDKQKQEMPFRRTFLRFIRSKLGFTFIVIIVLALFLVMLNTYTSEDLVDDAVDSGPRRGLSGFVDEEGVLHRGKGRRRHHHRGGAKPVIAVPVCQIPTLTLQNDANKHAYHDMEPLECPGEVLFYMHKGNLALNNTVLKGRKLDRCEYRAIEFDTDRMHQETKTYIEKDDPAEPIEILHDFFRVSCYLDKSASAKRKLLASELSEKEKEIINAAEEEKASRIDLAQPNIVGGMGLPDIPAQPIMRKKGRELNQKNENNVNKEQEDKLSYDEKDDYSMGRDRENDEQYGNYQQEDTPSSEVPDFDQFIAQIVSTDTTEERLKEQSPNKHVLPLNVMIFALDSMSHLCYQRKLPQTYKYIQETLGSIVLNGYNIVGDATTAAIIPLLTGEREEDLPEVRVNKPGSNYVDVYPFIWNKFEQEGYVTLYAEDMPHFGTFQLRMNGFEEQPVDHYMRPFWQAALPTDMHENSEKYCLGAVPEHNYTLGYVKQFMLKYKTVPKFSFTFIGELSHADNNPAQHIDQDLVNFLKMLEENGAFNNTVLIVMGDHGARYSKVRSTLQGKLEERLPMMSLAFPESFKTKYPTYVTNLKKNVNRLTTPFDIHETLKDLLDTRRMEKPLSYSDRGISVLKEIPLNRTCEAAGVAVHWCTCLQYEEVSVDDKIIKKVSKFVVNKINSLTHPIRDRCEELEQQTIVESQLVVPNEKVLKFMKTIDADQRVANFSKIIKLDIVHYQIILRTSPNDAMYEATIQHTVASDDLQIVGSISRINMYKDQADCIVNTNPDLRKYCMCKK